MPSQGHNVITQDLNNATACKQSNGATIQAKNFDIKTSALF